MNLHNFESCIDKKIVARGYDYYKNGYVIAAEETEKNVYVFGACRHSGSTK